MKLFKRISITVFVLTCLCFGYFFYQYSDLLGINIIPPSPQKYVEQALSFMDNQGIYSHTEEWFTVRQEVLEETKSCSTYEETYPYLEKALKTVGGKHSKLVPPNLNKKSNSIEMPEVKLLEDNIAYIKLPEFSGSQEEGEQYANLVYSFLKENHSVEGVILDLRNNRGGDMGPMLASISPLLPDGETLSFSIQNSMQPVTIENGTVLGGGSPLSLTDAFKIVGIKVAILQDENTASSAEATLLSFRGLDYTRTFGTSSAGYCSCNNVRNLYDGASILLTVGYLVPRSGEFFSEEAISPDIQSDNPLEEALTWIKEKG